jgi:hypothetical protein
MPEGTLPRSPVPRLVLLSIPPLGSALVALAALSDGLYRFLVREDALLEWLQVVAYLIVVVIAVTAAPRLWRRGDRLASIVVIGLGFISLICIGEELSWGQRLIGFGTPEIASQNRQGELTFHNDARVEASTHRVLLLVGLYGVLGPLFIRRRTPVVPPWMLTSCFAVMAIYYSVRMGFLDSPSYVEAKYSEWPETCPPRHSSSGPGMLARPAGRVPSRPPLRLSMRSATGTPSRQTVIRPHRETANRTDAQLGASFTWRSRDHASRLPISRRVAIPYFVRARLWRSQTLRVSLQVTLQPRRAGSCRPHCGTPRSPTRPSSMSSSTRTTRRHGLHRGRRLTLTRQSVLAAHRRR